MSLSNYIRGRTTCGSLCNGFSSRSQEQEWTVQILAARYRAKTWSVLIMDIGQSECCLFRKDLKLRQNLRVITYLKLQSLHVTRMLYSELVRTL